MTRFLVTLIFLAGIANASAQIETNATTYDLTLTDCLRQTFERHPDIQRARAEVERATGTKLVYRARALPRLQTTIQGGVREGLLYEPGGSFSTLNGILTQPLLDLGIPPVFRRARLDVIMAQQNLQREVTERLHEARVTFLRALSFRDASLLADEIATRLQANTDSAQQRRDAGTGTAAALTAAKIQQLNHARDRTHWRAEYFTAVTRLAELTGHDLTTPARQLRLPRPMGDLEFDPAPFDIAAATATALAHRADLQLLRTLAAATTADRQTAQAGYFPQISLFATTLFIPENVLVSRQSEFVPGQESRTTEWRAGVTLSWRVIDNGQVTGLSRQLAAGSAAYDLARRQLEQHIPREIAAVAGALETAAARRAALQQSAAAAAENLTLIEAQIALGEATQYDFLQAQANLLALRAGLVDATHAAAVARASLDRVTGRYLPFTPYQ